jgi:hypothetical protein
MLARYKLAEAEPPREPLPPKPAPRLRDGSLMLLAPALICLPVHASRLVRKFEARPIAAQPRPDLPRLHLTPNAPQLLLGLIQIATNPAGPTLATEVEESNPANTARAEEPWPAPTELKARPAEIDGLLDRLTLAQPIAQRDTTVLRENANAARRLCHCSSIGR